MFAALGMTFLTACSFLPGKLGQTNNGNLDLFGQNAPSLAPNVPAGAEEETSKAYLNVLKDEKHLYLVKESGEIELLYTCDGTHIIEGFCFDADEIYFGLYDQSSSTYEEKDLYRLLPSGECEFVDKIRCGSNMELYKDTLYTMQYCYDTNSDDMDTLFIAYERSDNLGFVNHAFNDEFIKKALDYDYGVRRGEGSLASLDKYGIFYMADYSIPAIVGYDENLNVVKSFGLKDDYSCDFMFDGERIVYRYADYYTDTFDEFVIDTNTGEEEQILIDDANADYYVAFVDGMLFYVSSSFEEPDEEKLYAYNLDDRVCNLVAIDKNLPGSSKYDYVNTFGDCLRIYDGCAYFVITTEAGQEWESHRLADNKTESLGLFAYENITNKYGRVVSDSGETLKEDGSVIYNYSVEGYEITANIPGREKMNEYLSNLYNSWLAEADRGQEVLKDYDPEWGEYYNESSEVHLYDVTEVGSHYLFIDFSGYDYYGGAHGMPFSEGYLFDINTGDVMSLRDMCSEYTEDEFKKIVAHKSIEKYRKEPEMFFFEGEDDDELWAEFYNNASFDMNVKYKESTLIIEYVPYEFGPFSSGYIEVYIPYDEAGIRLD